MRQNVFRWFLALLLSATLDIVRARELIFQQAKNCIVSQGVSNYLRQQGVYRYIFPPNSRSVSNKTTVGFNASGLLSHPKFKHV